MAMTGTGVTEQLQPKLPTTNLFSGVVGKPTNRARTLFINEREALNNMMGAGISEDEALNAITKKRQSMLKDISQDEAQALVNMAADDIDINEAVNAVKQNRYKNLPLWKKALKVPFDMSVGATSLVAEQVGNLFDFAGVEGAKEQVQGIKDVTQRSFEDSTAFQAGRVITGAGELIATGPTKIAPTLMGRVGQGAVYGAGVGGVEPILSKGSEATGKDILTGAAVGGALGAGAVPLIEKVAIPAIAGSISKIRKLPQAVSETSPVTRDLPKAIVKRDLGFTPTEREKIQAIAGKTEEDIILEKGLAGKSKEESAAFFDKNSNEVYNNVNKQLATTNVTTKSDEAKEALEDMLDQLKSSKKLEKAYADDIEVIKGLLAKEDYTGLELNNIRRAFDKVNTGMYTAKGLPKSGIENAIDVRIRQKLNDQIEAIAEQAGFSVKEMNQELRQSLLMKDALLRRLSQEQKNNFLGLQDIGVAGILTGGEPLSAALVIGAKKGAESLAPKFAQKLYNLNKAKNVPRTNVSRGVNITPSDSTNGGRLIRSSSSVSAPMVDGTKKAPKLTIGQPRQVVKETPKVIKKPSILSEKEKAKLLEGKKKPSILAKEQVKQAVSKLTKDNILEVSETIAKNYPGKLEQIKKVISDFIKKHGDKYIDKLSELVDEIATKVGAKLNIISKDGAMKEVKRLNPFGNNPYKSGDFKKLSDLDSDDLFRAIGTKDWENIPKKVKLYRGIKENKDFELFDGDFLTKNKKIAENFAGKNGRVKEFTVNTDDLKGSDFGYEEVIYKPNNGIDKTRVITKGDDKIVLSGKTDKGTNIPNEFKGKTIGKTDEQIKTYLEKDGFKQSSLSNSKGKVGDKYTKTINGDKIEITHYYKNVRGEDISSYSINDTGYRNKESIFNDFEFYKNLYGDKTKKSFNNKQELMDFVKTIRNDDGFTDIGKGLTLNYKAYRDNSYIIMKGEEKVLLRNITDLHNYLRKEGFYK